MFLKIFYELKFRYIVFKRHSDYNSYRKKTKGIENKIGLFFNIVLPLWDGS